MRKELIDLIAGIGLVGLVAIAMFFMLTFSSVHISGEIEGKGKLDAREMGIPVELEEVKIKFNADIPLLLVWQSGSSFAEIPIDLW